MAKAKRIKGIKCNSAARHGIKLVLLTRFAELREFREAALEWSDPEGVHSMRVASRRLRSALRDFMPYVRKHALSSALKSLKEIADALGEVRDQDVAILALEKLETHTPAHSSSTLKQFIDASKEKRQQSREKLISILEADHLHQLEMSFIAGVEEATSQQDRDPEVTFLQMSHSVILGRLKELEKLSEGLFRPFEVETLHEMRIAAKRLRYAIELFQQCQGRSVATYAKRAARIQTALGDLHDCDVWIESFGNEVSKARKQKDAEQLAAYVWLLSHFVKLRTKHLRQAFDLWRQWEIHDTSDKLRATLK
jgi:CHAD domain-containing protein